MQFKDNRDTIINIVDNKWPVACEVYNLHCVSQARRYSSCSNLIHKNICTYVHVCIAGGYFFMHVKQISFSTVKEEKKMTNNFSFEVDF